MQALSPAHAAMLHQSSLMGHHHHAAAAGMLGAVPGAPSGVVGVGGAGLSGGHGVASVGGGGSNGGGAAATAAAGSHGDLVRRVKKLQRESEKQKHLWWQWCEVHGNNVRDPKRHPLPFLREFMDAL